MEAKAMTRLTGDAQNAIRADDTAWQGASPIPEGAGIDRRSCGEQPRPVIVGVPRLSDLVIVRLGFDGEVRRPFAVHRVYGRAIAACAEDHRGGHAALLRLDQPGARSPLLYPPTDRRALGSPHGIDL